MRKLLIVEDEYIEREGLRDQVDWAGMDITVAGAVESAEKALDFLSNNEIDILMTDIKLLKMSGLELAQKVMEDYPGIKVIIISCYEEFDFARKAIDLKAYAYLTKPIDMDELQSIISKVTNTITTEDKERSEKERLKNLVRENMPLLKERFLNDLIGGTLAEEYIKENLDYFNFKSTLGLMNTAVVDMDNFENLMEKKDAEEIHLITVKILECINTKKYDSLLAAFSVSAGRYCLIFNNVNTSEEKMTDIISSIAEDIQQRISETCSLDASIGIGKLVNEVTQLKASYKKACEAVDFKFYIGPKQIINHIDVEVNRTANSLEDYNGIEKGVLSSIELCDKQKLNKNIEALFRQFESNSSYSDIYVRNLCINLLAKSSVLLLDMHESFEKIFGGESLVWDKILKFDTILDIQMWLKNIFNSIIDYLLAKRDDNSRKVIKDILKIIDERYNTNLTINDISKEVFLSANYISMIFRKSVGENFTDFLVKYRLEKAKLLLKETNNKVYEIGSMVGYSNISHFCSIFKHFYGVSPNEYRDKA